MLTLLQVNAADEASSHWTVNRSKQSARQECFIHVHRMASPFYCFAGLQQQYIKYWLMKVKRKES